MESGSFCESDIASVSHLTKRMSVRHVEEQLWTCLWQNQTFKADVCWRWKLQRSAKEPRAGRRDTAAVAVSCILYLCSVFLAVVTIYSQCLCFLWSSSNKFEDISIYIKQIKPIRLWNAFFSDPFPSVAHHVCILQFLSVKMWFSECRWSKWSLTPRV